MVSPVSRVVATALLISACSSLFELVTCQRKLPPKTTQVSEKKIRANFDCPEEFGYYPHPTDCTQYYVCVFGGALLESCTGGLMYSNELQTCDWPRNVGCDGLELSAVAPSAPVSTSSSSALRSRERESPRSRERGETKSRYVEESGSDVRSDSRSESRSKYTPQPPPAAQPKAVVTSRGQPRQLQERQQEFIKQQQLYANVEESLPPAEEIENDRQQRVYRGQPSTVGQVQRDRDGYRNTNSLPTYKDRGEKIGVISFGTQSQLQHYSNATDLDELTTNHLTGKTRRRRDAANSRPRKDASPWQSSHHQNNRYLQYNPYQDQDVRGNKHFLVYQQDEQRHRPYIPDHKRPLFTSASSHSLNKYPNPYNQNFQYFSASEKVPTRHNDPNLGRYVNKPIPEVTAEQRYNSFQPITMLTSNSDIVPNQAKPSDQKKEPTHDYTEAITKSYQDVESHKEQTQATDDEDQNIKESTENSHDDSTSDEERPGNDEKIENQQESNNPNQTYEYSTHEEYSPEDDDLKPPPSFFENKGKYEDIPNPFEDPNFDFDRFLEKLGSTTTTTTTSTTTRRPIPIKIPVYENLDDEQSRLVKNVNKYQNYNLENLEYAKSQVEKSNIPEEYDESKSKLNYLQKPKIIPSKAVPLNYMPNIELEKTNKPDINEDTTLSYHEITPKSKGFPKSTYELENTKEKLSYSTNLKEAKPIIPSYKQHVDIDDIPNPSKRPIDYNHDETKTILKQKPEEFERNTESYHEDGSKESESKTEKSYYNKPRTSKPNSYAESYHTKTRTDIDDKSKKSYYSKSNPYEEETRSVSKKLPKFENEYVPQTTVSIQKDLIKNVQKNDNKLKPLSSVQAKNYTHHVDKHQLHNDDFYKNDSDEKPKKFSSKIKSDITNKQTTTKTTTPVEYEYYYEYEDDDEPTTKIIEKAAVPESSNKIQNYHLADEILKLPTHSKGEPKYSARYQAKLTSPRLQEVSGKLGSANSSPVPLLDHYIKNNLNTVAYSTPSTLGQYTVPSGFHRNQYLTEAIPKRPTVRPATSTARSTKRTTLKSYKPIHTTSTYQRPDLKHVQSKFVTSDEKTAAPVSSATATARTMYNSSQYNTVQNDNRYDPYYALYDDEVQELYRDVDYTPQQNTYSNTNTRTSSTSYSRGTPATVREETPSRGKTVYNIVSQDIYQPSTVTEYADNSYQEEDYRQSSRTPARSDLFEINEVEADVPLATKSTISRKFTSTTQRTTTTTTTMSTPTPATAPPKKSTTPFVSSEPVTANETQALPIKNNTNPGHTIGDPIPLKDNPNPMTSRKSIPDTTSDSTLHVPYAVLRTPSPFLLPEHLTSRDIPEKLPLASRYITKVPTTKSTHQISTTRTLLNSNRTNLHINLENSYSQSTTDLNNVKNIVPTTYSPPTKYFLKSILPKTVVFSPQQFSFRPINKNYTRTPKPNTVKQPTPYQPSNFSYYHKTLKAVRKLINPISLNQELESSTTTTTPSSLEAAESFINDFDETVDEYDYNDYDKDKDTDGDVTFLGVEISPSIDISPVGNVFNDEPLPTTTTEEPKISTTTPKKETAFITRKPTFVVKEKSKLYDISSQEKYRYIDLDSKTKFRATVEIPPKEPILDNDDYEKPIPDEFPSFKPKPVVKAQSNPQSPIPTRASRVNSAIKSLIANGGTKGSSPTKCYNDPKCKAKSRTNSRGRGASQYSSGSIASNEVTVTSNRGTPPPRARPTLKPSTSIVSKAQEFVDIYRFPPRRPDPLYPQPQPDKTAAKCRKDVCLLPDCSCGGKEIPADLPVEQVPQIVLLTFDDSVNDLNKGLYQDLFERGRTNPNGCPISATFYVSHEWTDYSQVQNLYSDGHELASHTVSHSFGEQFSQKKWTREIAGQREILSAYGGVKLEDVRGMRAPFLSVGGNKMFKMLYDSNFTYDSSLPIYENKPPSWPYTLDYKLFHDCMIPPCPTRSYPGVWEVPMVMWQDLNGGRCSMGDACSNPSDPDGVFKMILKNFERHYTTNRAPFGLFYHAAWFTQPHHKEGFINMLDTILAMKDVWVLTNWQAIQWVRDPTPTHRLKSFQPFGCDYSDRPKRCNNPKVCNLWHKSGVRYMRTCQPCPDVYPWTGNTGIRSSRIDNDIED